MNLVRLVLRRGEAIAEARAVNGSGVLYFCSKSWCPHYQGQLGILAGTETMHCALVQYPPDRICQPFYLEVAEDLDKARRDTWQQRLAEAEAFEAAVAAGAAAVPTSQPLRPSALPAPTTAQSPEAGREGVPPLPVGGSAMGEGARG